MLTECEYKKECPAVKSGVVIREAWEVENGFGCAIGAELTEKSCEREKTCPARGKEGCLIS